MVAVSSALLLTNYISKYRKERGSMIDSDDFDSFDDDFEKKTIIDEAGTLIDEKEGEHEKAIF
jgi:hypothetical protein